MTHATRRALLEGVGGFWLRAMPMKSTDLPSGSKRRLERRGVPAVARAQQDRCAPRVAHRRQRGGGRGRRPGQQREDRQREQQHTGRGGTSARRGRSSAERLDRFARRVAHRVAPLLAGADARVHRSRIARRQPGRPSEASGRTSVAMADSIPFTKRPESSVENRLGQLDRLGDDRAGRARRAGGPARRRRCAARARSMRRHPLERPALGVTAGSCASISSRCSPTPSHQLDRERLGRHRQRRRSPRPGEIACVSALVEQRHGPLACLAPAADASVIAGPRVGLTPG